jgi:hypothetical protein
MIPKESKNFSCEVTEDARRTFLDVSSPMPQSIVRVSEGIGDMESQGNKWSSHIDDPLPYTIFSS